MQFQDELAGGVVLIRPALQSPDYETGVSGWAIKIDGSAEFNNVTIRGAGSADPLVVGPDGMPQVVIRTTPTNGLIVFPTNRAIEADAATLNSSVIDPDAADERAELQMTGPTVQGAAAGVRVVLASQPQDGSLPPSFSVQDRAGATTYLHVDPTEVRVVQLRIDSEQAQATDPVLGAYVSADGFDRFRIQAGGALAWGSGSAARDTTLYRSGADTLRTDGDLEVGQSLTAANLYAGTAQTPAPGGSPGQTSVTVNFPAAMPAVPRVVVTANSASADINAANIRWVITNKTAASFDIVCWRDSDFSTNFEWIAYV